jgi:hypothetical protein
MGKRIINWVVTGTMLLSGFGTAGHMTYKLYVDKEYTKRDFNKDIVGMGIMTASFIYGASKVIKSKLNDVEEEQSKLEDNLTK